MIFLALFILLGSLLAQTPSQPAKPVQPASISKPAPAAAVQSQPPKPAQPKRVSEVYQGDKFRDPFVSLVGAGASGGAIASTPPSKKPANIHDLVLKGMLSDKKGQYAIFQEPNTGSSFILKQGRLLNYEGKVVEGITGTIKGKKVTLMTQDKDVEQFSLE